MYPGGAAMVEEGKGEEEEKERGGGADGRGGSVEVGEGGNSSEGRRR